MKWNLENHHLYTEPEKKSENLVLIMSEPNVLTRKINKTQHIIPVIIKWISSPAHIVDTYTVDGW